MIIEVEVVAHLKNLGIRFDGDILVILCQPLSISRAQRAGI